VARPILHPRLAHAPWQSPATARLPGTVPVSEAEWLTVDAARAPQMAERDRLIAERPGEVIAALPGAAASVAELEDAVRAARARASGVGPEEGGVLGPDGRRIGAAGDPASRLARLGHLVQEDLCVLEKPAGADEHVLTAAILCFPAGWTLAEKIGRPLLDVHRPVAEYGGPLARRVQRLLDGLRPVEAGGRILMRMNAHAQADPALFQPRREGAPPPDAREGKPYLRIERQTLRKLPRTGAVVFTIHTTMLARSALTAEEAAAFATYSGASPHASAAEAASVAPPKKGVPAPPRAG